MAPNRKTHFHTMVNPNTNTLMSMLHGALTPKKATASSVKIVEIGTDKYPISVMEIASIDGKIWEKKACFDSISTVMYNHIDNLSTLDLITAVSSEVHMETTA